MSEYALVFLAGLAGSMHCVGMCGGFACALGDGGRSGAASAVRHLIYNLGRVATYCFLGAMVGQLGVLLVGHGGEGSWASYAQRGLALVSGLLMLLVGLQFLGCLPAGRDRMLGTAGAALARGMKQVLAVPELHAPLALGVLNGFLPCPLVYAFAAQAAGSGGPLPGLMVMAAFGLGTFPAMLAMGAIGLRARRGGAGTDGQRVNFHSTPRAWRLSGVRIAGAFILLLGLITVARGVLPMSAHLHGA